MSDRPGVEPPGPWLQPLPTEETLSNGVRLLRMHLPGQEVISARLMVPVTLADEERVHEGVSVMMARLLDEGAGDLDAEAFAAALERHGAALGASAVEGGLSVDLDVPVRHLSGALRFMADAVGRPTFPEEEVRRVLRNRLAEIDYETASAPHRAGRELIATLWDPASRAARPAAGTPSTIGALTRSAVVERHAALAAAGGALVIAGDLQGIDVREAVEGSVGEWTGSGPAAAEPAAALPRLDGPTVVVVDRPGSVQSELAIGAPAPGRADPSWAAYPVMAYLLGGSPGARIDAVLREDKGYTYGIRAAMRPRAIGGSFAVTGSVRTEVTAEALDLLRGILADTVNGFSRAELATGVDFITRATPGRWATADVIADELSALTLERLPMDFPSLTLRAMRRLAPDQVTEAAAAVASSVCSTVIVGDADAIIDDVRALGIGEVHVVTD